MALLYLFFSKIANLILLYLDDWISQNGWKRIHIIGDIPFLPHLFKYYTKIKSLESMASLITSAGRCFGCGNTVYGLPLAFKLALEDGTLKI